MANTGETGRTVCKECELDGILSTIFSLIPVVLSVCVNSIVRRKCYLNVLILCTKITLVKIKQLWSCLVTFILLTFSYITPKLTKYVIQAHFWLDDGSRGSSWTVGRSVQIILGAGPGGGAAGLILNKGDLTSNKPVSLTSPHPADEIKLFERLGN